MLSKKFKALLSIIGIIAIIPVSLVYAACGGVMDQSYTTNDNSNAGVYGVNWEAMTFTPLVNHTIGCVEVKMRKTAGAPGVYDVDIHAVTADKPSGASLASGTFDGDDVTAVAGGEWITVDLGVGTALTSGTEYAIVMSYPAGDAGNQCRWGWDSGGSTYIRGDRANSGNSGGAWTVSAGQGLMFKEFILAGVPTVTNSAAGDIDTDEATFNGEITDIGGDNADYRGFVWDDETRGNPGDTSPALSLYPNFWTDAGNFGAATFDHLMTGLPPDTTIYWRAFAHNTSGWAYSDELNFDTLTPIPGAPTDFTVTQTGAGMVGINWTMGDYAATTIIRLSEVEQGGCPEDYTDGYAVYDGALNYATYDGMNLDTTNYCIRAWSKNASGYSVDYAEAQEGGMPMLMLGFIGIAGFVTWFSSRRKNILLSIVAFLLWFGMGMWMFFSPSAPFDLAENYAQMLAWAFMVMSFIPFVLYMNVPITKTRKGATWTEYGQPPPEERQSEYERYSADLRARMHPKKKKKKMW